MLTSLSANGEMQWLCGGTCGATNNQHRDHQDVQFHQIAGHPQAHRMISLGACSACGGAAFLKVDFSAAELKAPNMVSKNGRPTPSYRAAQLHIQLAQQLEAAGKLPIIHFAPAIGEMATGGNVHMQTAG